MAENKVSVRIGGKEYVLRSKTDSKAHLLAVAEYVSTKYNEIHQTGVPTQMVPVMLALNLTDSYLKALKENEELKKQLENIMGELQTKDRATSAKSEIKKYIIGDFDDEKPSL